MNIILNRLKEIAAAVLSASEATELEAVLERIAEASRELVRTHYAALGIPDGKGGLRYFKTSGMSAEQIAKMPHHPKGHGLIGAIMHERHAIRLDKMRDDPRSSGFPEHHPHMTSFLGVPIQMGSQLFGMLYLSDRQDGQPFDEADQLLIETIASYAALAIAGANLRDQQKRLALLDERERIAMELHDGIIQSLYGIGMQVQLMCLQEEMVAPTALNPLIDDLDGVIEDIRSYIMDLRNRGRQVTVYESLRRIPERLHLPDHLKVEINAPHEKPPFSPAVFESICLIVNEAMSNAVRHANADTIQLWAQQLDGVFHITVQDNGNGFDLNGVTEHPGLGLRNMQQRARLYGGQVSIVSAQGQGTMLSIQIPIRAY